jgi:predicted phosphodiesterase
MSYPSRKFDSINSFAVVSDTHGLLREPVFEALKSFDLILHAGDIGPTELISVNDHLIYLLHDLSLLDLDAAVAGISMVVSGHSHRPEIGRCKGVLYVNPGSIGPRRFNLPISFAKVDCDDHDFVVELVHLEEGGIDPACDRRA